MSFSAKIAGDRELQSRRRSLGPVARLAQLAEHYLDTIDEGSAQEIELQLPAESITFRSDFCSDLLPKKRQQNKRFLIRIARGLYRYGSSGTIYLCRKVDGNNVWTNLQTTDRTRAMAIAAFTIYAAGQNGNTELVPPPQALAVTPAAPLPGWLANREVDVPAALPPAPVTQTMSPSERLAVDGIPTAAPPPTAPPPAGFKITINRQPGVTLADLLDRFREDSGHLAKSTRQTYDFHFRVAARHLDFTRDVRSINMSDLRQLKSKLCEGRRRSTMNDILFKVLGSLFRVAVEDGLIPKSPLEQLKRVKWREPDRKELAWNRAQQIVAEVEQYAPESAFIVGFMQNFGVGQAEVKYLLGEHFDLAANVIHFRRRRTGKSFDVPIFGHAKPFIELLKAQGRLQPGQPVVKWRNPRKALEAACQRLGLPSYEPRALRRCFIVHCLQQGIDPPCRGKMAGTQRRQTCFFRLREIH